MCTSSIAKVFGLGGSKSSGAGLKTIFGVQPKPATTPATNTNTSTSNGTPTKATGDAQTSVQQQVQDVLQIGLNDLTSLYSKKRGNRTQAGASTDVGTIGVLLGQ